MMKDIPLLSICIPTWNRAKFLDRSLDRMKAQVLDLGLLDVEIYISDNASPDNTRDIVQKYISLGLPITYSRNEENIGLDRNFLKCIQNANGKYIWLLGDDDFLKPGGLELIIDTLRKGEYGLLHLVAKGNKGVEATVCTDNFQFVKIMSFWSTFMSGNIFNRNAVSGISNPHLFLDSYLLQVPFFLEAFLSNPVNVYLGINNVLESGADSSSNGGYNFFEVFVKNYLTIWNSFLYKHNKPSKYYEYIRKDILRNFVRSFIVRLLVLRKDISTSVLNNGRKGWKIDNAWKILFKYYWNLPLFYVVVAYSYLKGLSLKFRSNVD